MTSKQYPLGYQLRPHSLRKRSVRHQSTMSNIPSVASPFGESLASDVDSVLMPPRRERYARKAAQNSKSWLLLKGRGSKIDVDENLAFVGDEEEVPPDFPRCATCAKPLSDQIWYNGRYFDHCQRYILHFYKRPLSR